MEAVSRWFALQVQPNYEKVTSQLLRHKGYEEFVPVYRESRQRSDRVKRIDVPLFPGYVFCRCSWHAGFRTVDTPGIVTTPGVVRIVGFGKQPVPIDDEEMENVKCLVQSGLRSQPCSYFEAGQKVRLTAGPLRGLEGTITNVKGETQLAVSVTLLQRSIAVALDPGWVEKV